MEDTTSNNSNNHIQKMRDMYPMYKDVDDITLAKGFRKQHYPDMDENDFLSKIGLNENKELTYQEKFESGDLKYKDTTPDDWGEKIKKDLTALSDKYIEPVLFGTGEDFKSKEWKIKDEIIEPFKASAKDVAQNDIMSDAIITIGDDANDPKKLKAYLEKRDTLYALNPMHHIQKEVADMDVKENSAKHNVDTFLEAYKKEGILSLDTWAEFAKAIPSVTAGSVPHTVAAVVNLPQAIKGYAYKLAKDSLEQDGIKREPSRTEYAQAMPVSTAIMVLDKFGFSKAAQPLKEEIAKAIAKEPSKKVFDVVKSFSTTTVNGVKYELPTELIQEGAEVAYVKDKDLTGEDLLKAGIGAVMGTVGMTTSIAAGKEVVSATKDTKQEAIDNAFSQFAQNIDNTQINQDALQQDTLNKLNPEQAQYKVLTPEEVQQKLQEGIQIQGSVEVIPDEPVAQVVKGFEQLQDELFGDTEQVQDDLTPKGYIENEEQSNNDQTIQKPQSTISSGTESINEPISQATVEQNEQTFTGENVEQPIDNGVAGDVEANKQKIEDNPLLQQIEQQSIDILKKKKAFNSEDYKEALQSHNETFTPIEDIKINASEYLETVKGSQDWQIPTLDKTDFGAKEIKPYALNSFNASEVNKNKDQYKFIPEEDTNYGQPIKGYIVNKNRYGFKINDTFIDMGTDMDIDKAWAFIHLYPEATKFQSGWYYPENEAIAKHKKMKVTLNKNEKIRELFENFDKVYDQLTPQQIEDIKQTADKMELERKSTELIDSLIDKVFNESATEQEIQQLDEAIEQGEKQNATNDTRAEDGRIQDIQTTQEQGTITQANNDQTKENVSATESTNFKPIKFDVNKQYSTKGVKHEIPSVEIAKKIQKDVAKYVGQLANNLGYEFDTDKKGKKKTYNGVVANIPPAGGSVRFTLWKPNSNYGVEVRLSYQPDYLDNGYENYMLQDLIAGGSNPVRYNVVSKDGKDQFRNISVYADKLIDESFVNEIEAEVNRQETKAIETKKDDIIKEDQGVNNESNTGTKRDTNQEANEKNPTGRTSTSKQGTSTTTRSGSDDTRVQSRQTGHDTDNTTSSKEYGLSAEDERVGRYDTDGGSEQDNQRGADENGILPATNNSDAVKLKNYDLTNKEPVSLTRGERKKINTLTKEILQKPLNEITEVDKEILRQYTGEGGLDDVTAGSVNQHYTNYETVKSMYDALYEAGFDFKRALEPAVGSGNFVGFASDKQWDIVDIDTTNINVATTLYPNAKATNDTFETFKGKNYDLIISNVPFASTQSLMREHAMTIKPAFKAIHNFYFAHSIDKVKDNGIVAFMTSTGTMDGVKEAQNLRAYLMKKADIIGAFRLPENSQRENTHTDTMIDIIFLQKRPDGVKSRQEKVNESFVKIGKNQGHTINQYFIDNPTHLLGKVEIGRDRTKMGKEGWIVTGKPRYEDMKISYEPYKVEKKKDDIPSFQYPTDAIKYADENNLVFKFDNKGYKHLEIKESDGKLYMYDEKITFETESSIGMFGKLATGTNAKKLNDLNEIMQYAEDYAKSKNENAKAKALELIKAYKSNHIKAPHSDTALKKYVKENRFDLQLKEYMSYFDKDFKPAALFEEDVRFKDSGKIELKEDSTLEEKAMYFENEDGIIEIYESLDGDKSITQNEAQQLLDSGTHAITGKLEVQNSIMYYSGNIYKKLDDLDTLLENKYISKEQYNKQYKKLKEILPAPTPYKDIKFKGIESWMPKEIQEKLVDKDSDGEWFLKDGFGIDGMQKHIVNNYLNGKTLVKRDQKNETTDEHRVKVLEANKLLRETLLPKIHEKVEQLGLSETIENEYNKFASAYVEPKLTGYLLKDMPKQFRGKPFSMQSHQLEGAELVVYNKKGVIAFAPGGGKTITAIVAVKQLLNQGVMKKPLFVVPVNTIHQWEETVRELYPESKVFEFPKIQRGKNKGQAKEWKDLSKDEKEQMIYDLTNNRYDFTIIGDTAFQKIGIPSDKVEQYANDLAEQITAAEEIEEDGGKKEQKSGLSLEAKKAALAKGIAAQYDGDVTVDIEKLGFDAIIADEVQYYKNIGMQGKDTKGDLGTNISVKYYERNKEFNSELPSGKNNTEYIQLTQKDLKEGSEPDMAKLESWRSYDFRFKTRFVSENNNGNNIILLTGTPTPNKPLELMTLLHHMDQKILDEYGIENVSDFVDTFLETETFETTDAQGKPKSVDGLGGIRNAQWLKKIIKRYVNYKGFEDMPDLPRPKQVDVKHYLSLSPAGEEIFGDILHRLVKSLEDSKSKTVSPENMEQPITMYGLGRDASIDLRLYNVGTKNKSQYTQEEIQRLVLEDERTTTNNKTKKVVDLVTKQYKENPQSGQIIFNDRIKYADENGSEKYIHSELRDEILASGLFEPNEVVIVTGQLFVNPETGNLRKGNLDNKLLQRIINDYNDGKIKVIIGNTAKLGVGVDLNKYTTDIYQMDIPYRPDEIEQRNNRGVRQGNINPEVRVHSFFQIGTFDKFSFDLIKKKEGFNNVYWKDVDGAEVTLDRGDNVDPYEMMIQIEKDVYKREKLRLERIIDQSAFIQKDIDKAITKLEETNKVKEQTIKGERGYEAAILNIDKELRPENYPKYESIKDENEKKAKLEKHIATLQDRKEKYKQKIQDAQDEIAHNEELINERKTEKSSKMAEVQRVIEDYTEEITKDKYVVRLEKIEELHSERELLEKEGKSKEEIEQYFKDKESKESESDEFNSEIPLPQDEQIEDDILFSKGVDNVGANYIQSYKASGFPDRSDTSKIEVAGEYIDLPTFAAPQTVESVREFAKDLIGNRLYDGKVKGKNRAGFYNRVNTGIRVKGFHDVETIAHEAAHYLDYYYKNSTKKAKTSFFKTFKNKHSEFLKSVSYTSQKALAIPEGFAEFVRLYTTRYNDLMAIDGASEVIADFEAIISKDKELMTKLHNLRAEAHKYLYQGHDARMSASSDNSLSKEAAKIKKKQTKTLAQTKQSLVDKNLSIKMIEEHLKGKDPIAADKSAYKMFNLVNGAEGTVDMTMEYGIPVVKSNGDIELDESKKSLDQIFKPLFDGGHDKVRAWENYAKAKRGAELKEQGRENRLDDQMIEAGLKLVEDNPEFETIFDEYQEFNDAMLDFYVGMKLITKDQKESFQEFNKDYVPFHRVKETIAHGKSGESVASSKLGARLKGGDGTINNIMDNIYGSLEKNIRDAYMARAKTALYTMLEKDGAEFAMKIGKDSKLVKNELQSQAKNVAGVLYSLGMGISKDGMIIKAGQDQYEEVMVDIEDIATVLQGNPQLLETWSIGHVPKSKDKMIDSAIIDGKRVYFEINDPMLIDTLRSQGSVYIDNPLMKFGIAYKNISTFMITNNPLFYLTNAFRDTVSAGAISENGFVPFYHTLKGMVHFVKKDKMYKNFMTSGAGFSTRRTALGSYDDINTNSGLAKRHFGAFHKLANFLAYGADLFEYGTRIGEYEVAKNKGKSNIDAAYGGREVSTDFSRSGSGENFRKFLGTVAFAKAGINSIDRFYRRLRDKKTKADKIRLYIAGSAIATFSMMLAMSNEDDERYQKLTKDQKSMYWWIYLDKWIDKDTLKDMGINPIWKLPKPYDIGIVFGNVPEAMFEYIRGNSKSDELGARLWFDMYRSGALMDFPSVFKGVLEVGFNKDWRGIPIESLGMQFQPKELRAKTTTPEIYKSLGNKYISPAQIHHLSNSFLGLYGRMIDDAMEAYMWNEKEKGERVFAKYNPLDYFASRLQGKEVESRTKYDEKFYKYYEDMIEAHGEVQLYKKQKDKDGIESFKKDKEKMTLYRLKNNADKVQSQLGQIRKAIQNISDGKTSAKTRDQKEKKINDLLLKKHKLLEKSVSEIEKVISRGKK